MECVDCREYRTLVTAWRKALKWTPGLDHALSVMLASVASTKSVGDQLWIKVIGPAACLDGDIPIHDPTNGSTKTVAERWKDGKKFFVYTQFKGEIGITQAMPPQRYKPALMYDVVFASGRSIRVTGGHRFWNGSSYVAVGTICDALRQFAFYRLPSISGSGLLARQQDAPRSSQRVRGYQCGCHASSHYNGELLPQGGGVFQDAFPLLSGVLGCNRTAYSVDGLDSGRRHTHQHGVHPSSLDSVLPCRLPRSRTESEFRSVEDTYGRCGGLRASSVLSLPQTIQIDRSQPSAGFAFSSKGQTDKQSLAVSEFCTHGPVRPSTPLQPGLEKIPVNRGVRTGRSFSGSMVSWHTPIFRESKRYGPITLTDKVISVKACGEKPYYDFHVPETQNYWANGVFHHNCGKSTLCEAISVNREYVVAKSTIRGFHSGYKSDGGDEEQDHSLIPTIRDKTLVTKDGDTLLQSPNLSQILAEARDLYDSTCRTHYRNAMSKDYSGIRMTWLLCGTSSLRAIDSSELGERFLDCVIMDGIDDELEDEVLWRVANRASRNLVYESDGKAETQYEPELAKAMQLTGGYVAYLRENAIGKLSTIDYPPWAMRQCTKLGKFVAHMRARPSQHQEENAEREFGARLVSQHVRLAACLALVLNCDQINQEVMRRTTQVAMDTSRGQTLDIAAHLYTAGRDGREVRGLSLFTNRTEEKTRGMLRFLKQIGVVELFSAKAKGITSKARWRLTTRMHQLYKDVVEPDA